MTKTTSFASRFYTDEDLENEGVWVDFGDGVEIKIRRNDTRLAADVFDRLYKPYRRMEQAGNRISYDDNQRLRAEFCAEALVADWKGIEDETGKKVKYDPENLGPAVEILKKSKKLRRLIESYAEEEETFRSEQLVEAEKNSQPSSSSS